MTIIMNMCSYDVEENSSSEIRNAHEANCEAVKQVLVCIHQPEECFNPRNRNMPISIATADIEIFLKKMSAK